MDIIQLILRSLQLLFIAIILGLTAGLIHGQIKGGSPASTNYVMFTAVWGAITVIVGFAAVFIYTLQGLIMAVFDAIAVVVFIIGSILYAVKLGVHSCTAKDDNGLPGAFARNPITNGGTSTGSDGTITVYGNVKKQCQMAQADDAFMFFALACFIASLVLDLFGGFKKRKNSYDSERA